MKRSVVFVFFVFLCGAVYGQNTIMTQADWNFLSPDNTYGRGPTWLSGSVGTNILIYRTLIQNDILVGFGGIRAKKPVRVALALDEPPQEATEDPSAPPGDGPPAEENDVEAYDYEIREETQFLFTVSDNIFVALNTKIIGLRAGFSGGLGIYSGELVQFFMSLGFLVGVHILPESLFSFTIDVKPAYTGTVRWDYENSDFLNAFSVRQHGWTFPFAISLRLNLDKL